MNEVNVSILSICPRCGPDRIVIDGRCEECGLDVKAARFQARVVISCLLLFAAGVGALWWIGGIK